MPDALLYNPHDGLSKFTYMGTGFEIPPNKVTVIVVPPHLADQGVTSQTIAGHAVASVGKWGVTIMSGDEKADEPRKKQAERTYSLAMRSWCEEQVLAYEEEMEPRRKAGLRDTDSSPDVSQARHWLEKRGFIKR